MKRIKSLEFLLEELDRKRVLISGVIQEDRHLWHVRLRPKNKTTTSQGIGNTFREALQIAWESFQDRDAWDRDYSDAPKNKMDRKRIKRVRVRK